MAYEYIKINKAGFPFNGNHPPNHEINGNMYHGYSCNTEETFFYDFAVQRYDLRFSYNGKEYYFLSTKNYAAQCDETFTNEICRYIDGNDVLEHFTIDGVRLLDLINKIQDVESI